MIGANRIDINHTCGGRPVRRRQRSRHLRRSGGALARRPETERCGESGSPPRRAAHQRVWQRERRRRGGGMEAVAADAVDAQRLERRPAAIYALLATFEQLATQNELARARLGARIPVTLLKAPPLSYGNSYCG
eukprot:SAG11_NODE_6763_length_1252_cov_1.277537_1_plen_134_part_00